MFRAPVAFDGLPGTVSRTDSGSQAARLSGLDVAQVGTCWEVGRRIVEFEQKLARTGRSTAQNSCPGWGCG